MKNALRDLATTDIDRLTAISVVLRAEEEDADHDHVQSTPRTLQRTSADNAQASCGQRLRVWAMTRMYW
jgi:hypothetical protein